jgi:glycosyltransferase involved in cell wall biosynthesis
VKVLYILGCNEGPSKRYRVFNHIEALKHGGHHGEWIWDIHEARLDRDYLSSFSIVVNFRGGYNDRSGPLFDLIKELGIPLVYDVDDLVFDPTVVDQIDVYRRMGRKDQQEYLSGMRQISRALTSAQYVTTSTTFLATYLEQYTGMNAWVIPFGVNDRQISIAEATEPLSGGPRFIGYLSGTKTHQNDFAEAAEALAQILTEYDDVYLKLIGYLDTEKLLPGLEHKIYRLDFMSWEDLLVESKALYMNLAPFEMDSLFCQAKSQLKFVETALCGVPTIASPVPSFAESIDNGVTGFIASNPQEWYEAMRFLLDDQETRDRIGAAAHRECMARFQPKAIGDRLITVYQEIIEQHRSGRSVVVRDVRHNLAKRSGVKIVWLIPQPFEGSGGHRNIFRAIRFLGEFGHECVIHVVPDNHRFANGDEIAAFIADEFFDVGAKVILGTDDVTYGDIMVSTFWTTAYIAKANDDRTTLQIYFLQDFEPMFYPMGTEYVRAMATYGFGFYFITSGPWPLRMLQSTIGDHHGDFFRFPIDRSIYYPADEPVNSPPRVIFFARPNMPRRCYPLGVSALTLVKQTHPDVEIVFYGDRSETFQHVPFPFTSLGMTDTIQELGDLYRTATVGLCFSTTNPSLVPFEMMASGCPVVDLAANGNVVNYGSNANAILTDPTPESLADGIRSVLDSAPLRHRLRENGIKLSKQFPTEIEMVRLIERYMLEELWRVRGFRTTISEAPKAGSKAKAAPRTRRKATA